MSGTKSLTKIIKLFEDIDKLKFGEYININSDDGKKFKVIRVR